MAGFAAGGVGATKARHTLLVHPSPCGHWISQIEAASKFDQGLYKQILLSIVIFYVKFHK